MFNAVNQRMCTIASFFVMFLTVTLIMVGTLIESIPLVTWSGLVFLISFYSCLITKRFKIALDPMCLMPAVGFAYCLATPLLGYCLGLVPFLAQIPQNEILGSTVYAEVYLIVFSVMLLAFPNRISIDELNGIFKAHRRPFMLLIDIFMWLFVIQVLQKYLTYGGLSIELSVLVRNKIIREMDSILFYSYRTYMFVAYSIFVMISFLQKDNTGRDRVRHIVGLTAIVVFYTIQLLSGNRREFSYFAVSIFVYLVYRANGKISRKIVIAVCAIGASLLALSLLRTFTADDVVSSELRYYTLFGELINPYYTLRYYMRSPSELKFGSTYLGFIPMLIPKAVWPDKPESLARTFVHITHSGIGYGFTPQTEAYINFGLAGCVIGGLLHFMACKFICGNQRKHPYFFFALFSQLINMFRGEFSSTFTEMIIISVTYMMIDNLNRVTSRDYARGGGTS